LKKLKILLNPMTKLPFLTKPDLGLQEKNNMPRKDY